MKLREDIFKKGRIVESDAQKLPKGVLCRVVYPICNIGKLNQNQRIYSRELWEKVLADESIMEKMRVRTLFGQAEHPAETQSDLQLTSHIITKTWIDESTNRVMQEMDVLNTPCGKIINTLLEAECMVGVSTRAEGELEEVTEGTNSYYNVIPTSYNYVSTDFTADPSTFNVTPQKYERNVVTEIKAGLESKKLDKHFAMTLLESMESKEAKQILKTLDEKVDNILVKEDMLGKEVVITEGVLKGTKGKVSRITETKVTLELDNGTTIETDTGHISMDTVEINTTPVGGGGPELDVVEEPLDQMGDGEMETEADIIPDADVTNDAEIALDDKEKEEAEDLIAVDAFESKKVNEMSRFTRSAQTDDQEEAIRVLEDTLGDLGVSIVGGTAIGTTPQTIVLDLTRQGGEIHAYPNGYIEVKGQVVDPADFWELANILDINISGPVEVEPLIQVDVDESQYPDDDKQVYDEMDKEGRDEGVLQSIDTMNKMFRKAGKDPVSVNNMVQYGADVFYGKSMDDLTPEEHLEVLKKIARIAGVRPVDEALEYTINYKTEDGAKKKFEKTVTAYNTVEAAEKAQKLIGEKNSITSLDVVKVTDETKINERNFKTKAEFINYLEGTLIPDLYDSGKDATAEDFVEAVEWLQDNIEDEKKFEDIVEEGKNSNACEFKTPTSIIRDLKIAEASATAEKEKAIELLEEAEKNLVDHNTGKVLELKLLVNKLNDYKTTESIEVKALCKKLEEKTSLINHIKKQVLALDESYKKDLELLEKEVDSYKKEISEAAEEYKTKLAEEEKVLDEKYRRKFIKQYVNIKLESSGCIPHTSTRALLEKKNTVKEVDECFDEFLDIMRQNALHSKKINEVIIEKEEQSPEIKRIDSTIRGFNF